MQLLTCVPIGTEPSYEVRVGRGALADLQALIAERPSAALIADERVAQLHLARLPDGNLPLLRVPAGEACKELSHLGSVLEALAASGLERASLVATLGGGATSDLGGLAAALYLRGVDFVACPTTLLAMVDASVGGKTAINLGAGKNLAGVFHQPRAVLADLDTLATLPAEEWRSGLGEVAKTWLIAGDSLEPALAGVGALPPDEGADWSALGSLITACVQTKARLVAADAREAGPRKALNLGHTFGHAIEHVAGYGRVPHGIAVAVGLGLATRYAARIGLLEDMDLPERLGGLLSAWGLPPSLSALRRSAGRLDADALIFAMGRDKKNAYGRVRLVLPRRAGDIALDVEADPVLLREVLLD
jgi:3-dehydroquinate synthase